MGIKVASHQNNFTCGEISPLAEGRYDIAKYPNAVKYLENFLNYQLGGALFRPGSYYVALSKENTYRKRLLQFQFSTQQAYVIEAGDYYIRFFADQGQVLRTTEDVDAWVTATSYVIGDFVQESGIIYYCIANHTSAAAIATDIASGYWLAQEIYEVPSPYSKEDVLLLHKAQNADTMYVTVEGHIPHKLQRTAANIFTFAPVEFKRGPFRDSNITDVTIQASGDGGPSMGTEARIVGATQANPVVVTTRDAHGYSNDDIVFIDQIYSLMGKHNMTEINEKYFTVKNKTATTFELYTVGDTPAKVDGSAYHEFAWSCRVRKTTAATEITLTASAAIFDELHVGSLWRIKDGVVKISQYTSGTVVKGIVQTEPDGTAGDLGTDGSATTDWSEGAFSDYRGWPATCFFYEGRLYYASNAAEPQKKWGSVSNAYDNFKAGVNDGDAVTYEIASEQVNAIRWMSGGPKSMQIGTSGGTFSANGGGAGVPITPTSIAVQQDTSYGVAPFQPKTLGSNMYFLQRNLFQLRELLYNFYTDSQVANDMNLLADHILRDGQGAVDFAYQQSPNDRFWVVRADGQIAVLTRNPEQDVMGWARLTAGVDGSGKSGKFESVCIIQKDGEDDEVWVEVKRIINGQIVRTIEYFAPEYFADDADAMRLDCALTYDVPVDINSINLSPVLRIETTEAHGISNGDHVKIQDPTGTEDLNDNIYVASDVTATTLRLKDEQGDYVDSSDFTPYIEGGVIRKAVTQITGLDHLEGEEIYVVTDGGTPDKQDTYTVESGAITLLERAFVVHCGLKYDGKLKLLKLTDGQNLTQTKNRMVYLSTLRLYRSACCFIGMDEDHQVEAVLTEMGKPLGRTPPLFTGDIEKVFEGWWTRTGEVTITQTKPLPLLVLAIVLRSEVEEK